MEDKIIDISTYINKKKAVEAILTNDETLIDDMYTDELTLEFNRLMNKERGKEENGISKHKD